MKNDFLGVLRNDNKETKKNKIIEIYRYFFRFSIERVKNFIDHPIMMIIVLEYLKQTHMTRIYRKKTLKKNIHAYYKAMENIINLSQFKHSIFSIMPAVLGTDRFSIIIDD